MVAPMVESMERYEDPAEMEEDPEFAYPKPRKGNDETIPLQYLMGPQYDGYFAPISQVSSLRQEGPSQDVLAATFANLSRRDREQFAARLLACNGDSEAAQLLDQELGSAEDTARYLRDRCSSRHHKVISKATTDRLNNLEYADQKAIEEEDRKYAPPPPFLSVVSQPKNLCVEGRVKDPNEPESPNHQRYRQMKDCAAANVAMQEQYFLEQKMEKRAKFTEAREALLLGTASKAEVLEIRFRYDKAARERTLARHKSGTPPEVPCTRTAHIDRAEAFERIKLLKDAEKLRVEDRADAVSIQRWERDAKKIVRGRVMATGARADAIAQLMRSLNIDSLQLPDEPLSNEAFDERWKAGLTSVPRMVPNAEDVLASAVPANNSSITKEKDDYKVATSIKRNLNLAPIKGGGFKFNAASSRPPANQSLIDLGSGCLNTSSHGSMQNMNKTNNNTHLYSSLHDQFDSMMNEHSAMVLGSSLTTPLNTSRPLSSSLTHNLQNNASTGNTVPASVKLDQNFADSNGTCNSIEWSLTNTEEHTDIYRARLSSPIQTPPAPQSWARATGTRIGQQQKKSIGYGTRKSRSLKFTSPPGSPMSRW